MSRIKHILVIYLSIYLSIAHSFEDLPVNQNCIKNADIDVHFAMLVEILTGDV